MKFQITRFAFCPSCFKRGHPHHGQWYTVFDERTQQHMYGWCEGNSAITRTGVIASIERGFVPHLFIKVKGYQNHVVYHRICLMHQCGVYLYFVVTDEETQKKEDIEITRISKEGLGLHLKGRPIHISNAKLKHNEWLEGTLSIPDWNALVGFRDSGYEM